MTDAEAMAKQAGPQPTAFDYFPKICSGEKVTLPDLEGVTWAETEFLRTTGAAFNCAETPWHSARWIFKFKTQF